MAEAEYKSDLNSQKTSHIMGELWGAYCANFGENLKI